MRSGLFYAIVMRRRNARRKTQGHSPASPRRAWGRSSSNASSASETVKTVCAQFHGTEGFVAATGGRYDALIEQYQLSSRPRHRVAAMGSRFHVERIASQLIDPQEGHASTATVLVASPCDEEPTPIEECVQIADQLRKEQISADWMHPFDTNPASAPISDRFMAYCRSHSIPYFVNKRRGQSFRIRSAFHTGIDKEFLRLDQIVTFIKARAGSAV